MNKKVAVTAFFTFSINPGISIFWIIP